MGTAAYLNVFGSIYRVLKDLQRDGYDVGMLPMSEEALIKSVLTQARAARRRAPGLWARRLPPRRGGRAGRGPAAPRRPAPPRAALPRPHSPPPCPPPLSLPAQPTAARRRRPPARLATGGGQVQLRRPEHRLQDERGRVPEAVPVSPLLP